MLKNIMIKENAANQKIERAGVISPEIQHHFKVQPTFTNLNAQKNRLSRASNGAPQ